VAISFSKNILHHGESTYAFKVGLWTSCLCVQRPRHEGLQITCW